MEKEKWIDEVMSSLQGAQRAEPNPFLFTRIEERLKSKVAAWVPVPKLSLVLSGIALLCALNFFALKFSATKNTKAGGASSAYSLNTINYQLY
jgi:hypothetical protein